MSAAQREYVKDVCFGRKTPADFPFVDADAETKAAIWELASDYLKFLLPSGKIAPADYRKRVIMVLSARKDLGQINLFMDQAAPQPPHLAHGSSRVDIGGGHDDKGFYSELGFRITAHDTMDADPGYTKNSQMVFGHADVRYQINEKKISLRALDLVDIVSLPTSDSFFLNWGFNFRTGLESNQSAADAETLAWRVKIMPALSSSPAEWLQAYAFAGADSYFAPSYRYGTDLLPGGEVGVITTAGVWKSRLAASLERAVWPRSHTRYALSADERIAVSQDVTLTGSYRWEGDYGVNAHELSFAVHFFY